MDVKQTMLAAYRCGLNFDTTGCLDTECDCNGLRILVGGDQRNPPDVELTDALAQHASEIGALLCAEVYRETRH